MNRPLIALLLAVTGVMLPTSSVAQLAHNCAYTRISSIRMPVGPAHFQSGLIRLANGATVQLTGAPQGARLLGVRNMRVGDRVSACYGPLKSYADAPPSRAITVIDRNGGQYFKGPIGSWPGMMSQ